LSIFICCCTGVEKIELPMVEARGAQYIAAASATVVVSVIVVIVLLDIMTLVSALAQHHSKHYAKQKCKCCWSFSGWQEIYLELSHCALHFGLFKKMPLIIVFIVKFKLFSDDAII